MEREMEDTGTTVQQGGSSNKTTDGRSDPLSTILQLDDVFDALGHAHRRYVVYRLTTGPPEARLTDLATDIAAWEADKDPADVTPAERERLHVSLRHIHFPVLQQLGIVEYDETTDVVRAGTVDRVHPLLERASTLDPDGAGSLT